MTNPPASRFKQFGAGPLSRWSGAIYWAFVIEVLILATSLPTFVVILLLDRDRSNIPLYALALVPLGPSLAAALFAWRSFLRDSYPTPLRQFLRGYRLNWLDVLKVWVPILVFFTVIAMNLAYLEVTNVLPGIAIVMVLLGVAIAVWAGHVFVLSSLFSFPVVVRGRLALYHIASRPLVALGNLSLLIASAGIIVLWSDWVLVALASVMTWFWLRTAMPVIRDTEEHFVIEPPEPDEVR